MTDQMVTRIAERAAEEVAKARGEPIARPEAMDMGKLPAFMRHSYFVAQAVIGGRPHVFFVPRPDVLLSAGQIAAHTGRFCGDEGRVPVLATGHMTRKMAERLVSLGVSFVVPGRHLSVEGTERVMGSRFDPPRSEESHPRPAASIGPYAQAILLLQILRGDPDPMATMSYARHFSITQTTALKAAGELVRAGLCHREKDGTPQPLEFLLSGRDLFVAAMPRLASPVSNVGYLAGEPTRGWKPNSGEWALAQRSMLAEPMMPSLAIHRGWPLVSIASRAGMEICNREDADLRVERWRYPPEALSQDGLADPLSLFLMFRDHQDARVAMAAYNMLEDFWERGADLRSAVRPAVR